MSYVFVAVGVSTGGLAVLGELLSRLPADFGLPVAVVQHRVEEVEAITVHLLQRRCAIPVSEVGDGERVEPGRVYLAPPGYHLLVDGERFALSTAAPVQHARPSIDVLFESAAEAFRERAIALVLTGRGRDGAAGAARVKALGGMVVVQEPATAEEAGMPTAAIAACQPDAILSPSAIADLLVCLAAREKEPGHGS